MNPLAARVVRELTVLGSRARLKPFSLSMTEQFVDDALNIQGVENAVTVAVAKRAASRVDRDAGERVRTDVDAIGHTITVRIQLAEIENVSRAGLNDAVVGLVAVHACRSAILLVGPNHHDFAGHGYRESKVVTCICV